MEYRRQSNGWRTFLENWWFLVMALGVILGTQVFNFFTTLTGMPWIWCYGIGLAIAAGGISLIFYAKLAVYRQRQFVSFGTRALPEGSRQFYRWGYRCVLLAVALLLCLFLSRP